MSPDFDMHQADAETNDKLMVLLENEKKVNDDLVMIIDMQDRLIKKMRERMKSHGLAVLEKSIIETSREELALINKSIPKSLTERAKNPDAMKRNYHKEMHDAGFRANEQHIESLMHLISSVTEGVDLDKHGIDPVTLKFLPGWGPNGRLSLWQNFKAWLSKIFT